MVSKNKAIAEKIKNIWKEIIPPDPKKPKKDPKDMDEFERARWAATVASSIYPTGNRVYQGKRVECMVVHRHPKAVAYAKKHYATKPQIRDRSGDLDLGGLAIVFSTQGQVRRAIEHMTKKFEFESIENWANDGNDD